MAGSGEARLTPHKGFGDFPMYGFFDLIESDGVMLSEDLSFCARWRAMGGQVHAMNSAHVGHVGAFVYRGSFFDKLRGA